MTATESKSRSYYLNKTESETTNFKLGQKVNSGLRGYILDWNMPTCVQFCKKSQIKDHIEKEKTMYHYYA